MMVWYFSSKHRLHLLLVLLYSLACLSIFHLMLWFVLPSFNFQMCFLSAVSLLFCLCLNDPLWPVYLDLNVVSHSPMYASAWLLSVRVTVAWYVAWYIMAYVRHWLSSGQSCLFLRLHVFWLVSSVVAFGFSVLLLCASIVFFKFDMQELLIFSVLLLNIFLSVRCLVRYLSIMLKNGFLMFVFRFAL